MGLGQERIRATSRLLPARTAASAELTFKDAPNFESPADDRTDNLYKVTVTASSNGATGTFAVEITITDEDEDGKPKLSKPQPQVGRGLEATGPNDPDKPVTDVLWQWSRGDSMDGPWENIGKPASSGSREPTDDDEDMFLRATAMYTDKFGSGKTASVVSENAVEPRTLANAQPSFAGLDTDKENAGTQVMRTVDENAKGALVGKPITASDDDDVLVYSLVDVSSEDVGTQNNVDETALFAIDPRTAQITTKKALDSSSESGEQDTTDDTDENEVTHTVGVSVIDPSGATNSQDVTIVVNNVNDAPAFPDPTEDANQKAVTVAEDLADTALQIASYDAGDDDAADDDTDAQLTYVLDGADKGAFTISNEDTTRGQLSLKKSPNYEKQMEYSVTIMAEDDEFAVGSVDLVVTVTNSEDEGSVSINVREPQVGKQALASLSDEDGTVRGQSWQWYRNVASDVADATLAGTTTDCEDTTDAPCRIAGATSPAYTPKAADEGENKGLLAARVTYSDACVRGDTDTACDGLDTGQADQDNSAFKVTDRDVQIDDPANTAPKFDKDQDPNTPGDQEVAEREVPENMETTVGDPVKAVDTDLLMYSVDPDDNFKVDNEGLISTKVKLDYEGLPEDAKYYMVMLTAIDPSGASASIMVKITVTDEDDAPTISLRPAANVAPAFADDAATEISVMENMPAGTIGDPYTATDENGGTLMYSLSGSDYFEIDDMGQISTTMMLDHEAMDNHMVTITATDSDGATDTLDVTIMVGDMHPDCPVDMGLTNDCEALLDAKGDLGGSLNWDTDTAMA